MMTINSTKTTVHKSQKACFDFLSRPENYKSIMPERTEKFELNAQGGFIFQLKGMPEIRLKLKEKTPDEQVAWESASDKFTFTMTAEIEEKSAEETAVQFLFQGEFNAMMAMMVKKPLQKFIDTLSQNLKTI